MRMSLGAAVDEDDGLALALLAVRKRGSVDVGGRTPRTGSCVVTVACVVSLGMAAPCGSALAAEGDARNAAGGRAIGSSPHATSPCSIANSVAAARVDTPILR